MFKKNETKSESLLFPLLVFLFLFATAGCILAQESARIEIFSPQGTVKKIRQAQARFSEPIVPVGDPRAVTQPFDIDCSEKGTARWADDRNWAYDFDRDLPAGVRCQFKLKDGLKTLAGREITGQKIFAFSTGGPAILQSTPFEGDTAIDDEQIFILELDAEPTQESVLRNVAFIIEGTQNRVGIRIISGEERAKLLKTHYRYRKGYEKPLLVIQARQRFPEGSKISLVWGKDVASHGGVTSEQDQVLPFQTRPVFTATFHCLRENPNAQCIPITPMTIRFSAPVTWAQAKNITLRGPGNKEWKASRVEDEDDTRTVYYVSFKQPFPEKSEFRVYIPAGIRDDASRRLTNAREFPLVVRTDEYPPLAKFSARFGIVEKSDPVLPVTVRNLEPQLSGSLLRIDDEAPQQAPPRTQQQPAVSGEQKTKGVTEDVKGRILKIPSDKADQIFSWLRRIHKWNEWDDRDKSIFDASSAAGPKKFSLPKPNGAKAFEVIGIPLKEPGFYVVELDSAILGAALIGKPKRMFVATTALVTNLAVHFKWGIESSLVWVTALDSAKPVKSAAVQIKDCHGAVLWTGITDDNGVSRVDKLPARDKVAQCSPYPLDQGLFVTAQTSGDFSFVHSSWDKGIEPWRFQFRTEWDRQLVSAHSIFDRSLLRAGETVHMKHILRKHVLRGFLQVAEGGRPTSLLIEHLGGGQEYKFPLKWNPAGSAETEWKIPKGAKLGLYQVSFVKQENKQQMTRWYSGNFHVEEYRVPLMRGSIQPPAGSLISPPDVTVDLTVRYLAGGGASDLPVKLRHQVRERYVPPFEGFDDFAFANGVVREGLTQTGDEEEEEPAQKKEFELKTIDLKLDKTGSARAKISSLPKAEKPLEVLTELEFKDPNGETQTASSLIPLWPSKTVVGIKPESWALSKESLKFFTVVLDLSGKPIAGAPVKVDLFQRKAYSHRKRLIGGFYAYEHFIETKKVKSLCEGKTDSKGLMICQAPSPVSGNIILQATTTDDAGHSSVANQEVWVAGKEDWWFEVQDHDRMDLLPERKRYEPGEKATFQVRMPFREATALVTVEREGISDVYLKTLSGKEPVVEIPIKPSYAPNVYVSVLAVRGRVTGIQPTATVDLGRPAYKLGIAEIRVGWKTHELKVSVTPDRQTYHIREKAKVKIAVKKSDGKFPPPRSEVCLAAIDEGLLELMANRSWDLLDAMMGKRGYAVQTATAQMHVVGKRHYGLKALPQGGGGGKQMTRELFDTLLLWKGRVPLDSKGEALVEVPLNDSLTSFRIVAVATGGIDLFGTGAASIRSTQDLMVLSGIAPVVRQGDKLLASVTVRNSTNRAMEAESSAAVTQLGALKPIAVSLSPGEAKEIGWNITVPTGIESLKYTIETKEKGGSNDRLVINQKVAPVFPVRPLQATIAQLEKDLQFPVERPKDALPGGGVNVLFRASLLEGLDGVKRYMQLYPYTCLEQKVSQAVALRDEKLWKSLMADLPSYLDGDGLAKYFPNMALGSEVLTSYLLSVAHEAGWAIPKELQGRMESGLKGFIEGKIIRYRSLPTADLSIRKMAAVEALSRYGKAEPQLLSSITIQPNLWPTSAALDWFNVLARVPAIPDRDQKLGNAEQILRSRLNFQGTIMGFSTEQSDHLWWLMISGDSNATRLILSLLESGKWTQDMPRLVRGALGRQRQGAWDLTVANAWGTLAVEKFAKTFEKTPVSGTSTATLAAKPQSVDWTASAKGKSLLFTWPAGREALSIHHTGSGRPWVTIQSLAAIPLRQPLSTGFKIKKTLIPVEQKQPAKWTRGDLVRVRLELESQADMTWVVLSDPVAAGSTILGSAFATESAFATQGEKSEGWVWPAFQERSFEAYRAYYEYVPKGKWTVEYTARLNNEGVFHLPPTRIEAMYSPEMFGEIPNADVRVLP
ncbi:MAG TPA: MG2 domain-containing protein [Acidobacteriota bacterium]|nr:MG2 domain-containing protein [Acidobacteriota bacterium]